MGGYSIFEGTIADMTWMEVGEAAQRGALMLVPVAVIEQHGPHLPLATDTYAAYLLCIQVRAGLENRGIEALVAPPYFFGMNPSTGMFPGSISMTRSAMVQTLSELMGELGRFGFNRQFVINHHGDPTHNDAIIEAITEARATGIDAVLTLGGIAGRVVENVYTTATGRALPLPEAAILRAAESEKTRAARERLTRSSLNVHAEETETSMMMRWFPELVSKVIDISELKPVLPNSDELALAIQGGHWREIAPAGYIGDPSVAAPENGELYALDAADIAEAIRTFVGSRS